jgi:GT2 family glycosyltransferase
LTARPVISVVVPTRNRAGLLRAALKSLIGQTLPRDDFEVIVVDDGSVDDTAQVCSRLDAELRLKYFRLPRAGISAAKNLGIFASSGAVTLFFDDDDLADADLLTEHVRAHQRHPEENLAVLGYTTWAPGLPITDIMHYLTEVGQNLFTYRSFRDGEIFGFTKFWGGRTSCKRTFLVRCGVFNQIMPGFEDIELGYRLARHGLRVLFHRRAVSYMNRQVTYDDFCRRSEMQGHCRVLFTRLHSQPGLVEALGMADAEDRWQRMEPRLDEQVRRVHELEATIEGADDGSRSGLREELFTLYRTTITAFYLKGTIDELREGDATPTGGPQPDTEAGRGSRGEQGRAAELLDVPT